MCQFCTTAMARDLLETAHVDGCVGSGICRRIRLPLLKPELRSPGMITFIAS